MGAHEVVVVGAGLFGLTIAERIATELKRRVLVLDCRSHIGGNCFSEDDPETGIEVHSYGSHIFHCSSERIWRYISQFCRLNDYRHHVYARHRGRIFAMPINMLTITSFFGRAMTPDEAQDLIRAQAAELAGKNPENLEEKAISLVGSPLYEAFIRGYTRKQWGTDPRQLPAEVITRLPVRYVFNSRYFSDKYEGIPVEGYGALLRRMTENELITLWLGVDFFAVRDQLPKTALLVYSGPVDRYFDFRCGRLGWRAVRFERSVMPVGDFQGTSVVNYTDEEVPFTRIHEFRHYHPERSYTAEKTVIFREYSQAWNGTDSPAYPINTAEDRRVLEAYADLAQKEQNVIFGGRLGTYRYFDMHQVIGSALVCFDNTIRPYFEGRRLAGTFAPAVDPNSI